MQWTGSVIAPRDAAAADVFTAFPCGATNCTVARVIADADRNTYVVGSRSFQVQEIGGAPQVSDVFVAKLDASGATVFLATLGGKGIDRGRAIALDAAGNVLIGGSTTSPNFPLRNAVQKQPGSGATGFLAKLSPDGSQLIYSTYFGGSGSPSAVNAVAADSAGNAWITGNTGSRDFAKTPGMPAGAVTGFGPGGILGAFVAKLSATGDKILASGIVSGNAVACSGGSSCFLSIRNTSGDAIALDGAGNAYVAGNSNITDLPTTEGAVVRQGLGGWAARINASGTKLDYLTYLDAARFGSGTFVSAATGISALAVDAAGNAWLAGGTSNPKFPVTAGAVQPVYNGPANPEPIGAPPPSDVLIARLNPQGTAITYATFLGGSAADRATALALDSTGAAYVAGTTESADFPVTGGTSKGGDFIAALNPAGSAMRFAFRFPSGSVSQSIAVDSVGRVLAASPTGLVHALVPSSAPGTRVFGITSGAGGLLGPAVAPGEVVSLFGTQLAPGDAAIAQPVNGKMPTSLAGTQVLFDGIPAPLLYVSRDQINAVTPFALSPGKSTIVRVVSGSATSPDFQGLVVPSRPAIFGNGNGIAAAVNQDGTINDASHPAKLGSIVSVWGTGIGPVYPAPADGQVATGAEDYHCCSLYILGKPAEVLYAGAAPGIVAGVVQINFRVPADMSLVGIQQIGISTTANPPALDVPATSIFVGR